jgi:hypothetical protein
VEKIKINKKVNNYKEAFHTEKSGWSVVIELVDDGKPTTGKLTKKKKKKKLSKKRKRKKHNSKTKKSK